MSYVLGPYKLVKGENAWPEFREALKDLEKVALNRALEIWDGYTFGGIYPGDKQFGICPLRQNEMAADVSATTLSGSYSFRKNYGATAWRPVWNYTTRKDVLHAFAGFMVPDEILNILQLRMEISDRKYPIFDIQEAKGWGSFAILFKEDAGSALVAEPETSVYIRAYLQATGYQTLTPLGFQLYKRKDLVISEV